MLDVLFAYELRLKVIVPNLRKELVLSAEV
jgi:hypothetical protein